MIDDLVESGTSDPITPQFIALTIYHITALWGRQKSAARKKRPRSTSLNGARIASLLLRLCLEDDIERTVLADDAN